MRSYHLQLMLSQPISRLLRPRSPSNLPLTILWNPSPTYLSQMLLVQKLCRLHLRRRFSRKKQQIQKTCLLLMMNVLCSRILSLTI
ncbi:hypothetical protein SERLADRAFT_380782, partial [Serpula lacrymans var. lacrymans S7.9]